MNKSEIISFCKKLDKRAGEICKGEYEIYAVTADSFSVKVIDGKIEDYRVNDTLGISFRVKCDGKMGYSSTTALDEDGIDTLINSAVNNATIIESKDEQFIFKGSDEYVYPKIYSEELEKITPAEKIELAKKLERATLEYDKKIIRTMGSCVYSACGIVVIRNSHGLNLESVGNTLGAYVMPIASDGKNMNSGIGAKSGYSLEEIKIDEIVKEACDDAIDFCTCPSYPTGQTRIIIKAQAMADLIETFLPVFSADNAQRGISMLAGKEGKQVASETVTIIDNPLIDYGNNSRAFDAEGVCSKINTVVEKGVLKTLLYNLKTASKAGIQSTANASKASYSSPVGISCSNFILWPGKDSFEDLVRELGDGIVITSLAGLHSGADATTGDFSLSAQGYAVKNGEISHSVKGITVTSNFYTVLKEICKVGCDTFKSPFGDAVLTPSVLLKSKISVSGEENA